MPHPGSTKMAPRDPVLAGPHPPASRTAWRPLPGLSSGDTGVAASHHPRHVSKPGFLDVLSKGFECCRPRGSPGPEGPERELCVCRLWGTLGSSKGPEEENLRPSSSSLRIRPTEAQVSVGNSPRPQRAGGWAQAAEPFPPGARPTARPWPEHRSLQVVGTRGTWICSVLATNAYKTGCTGPAGRPGLMRKYNRRSPVPPRPSESPQRGSVSPRAEQDTSGRSGSE